MELSEPHSPLTWCGESRLLEHPMLASCHKNVEPVFKIFTISYFSVKICFYLENTLTGLYLMLKSLDVNLLKEVSKEKQSWKKKPKSQTKSEIYLLTKSNLFYILGFHNSANFYGLLVTYFWAFSYFAPLLLCGKSMPATHELTNKLSVYWKQFVNTQCTAKCKNVRKMGKIVKNYCFNSCS